MLEADSSGDDRLERLVAEIRGGGDLPAVAEAVQRLQTLFRRENANTLDIARTILQDPAISSKILRVVNSAFYQRGGAAVSTITRAVVLLGVETIRDLALGLLLIEEFIRLGGARPRLRESLRRSLHCGLLAQQLSLEVGLHVAEEAYLLGLFAHLSLLWLSAHHPEELERAMSQARSQGIPLERALHSILGVGPSELSAKILESWSFPATYVDYFRHRQLDEASHARGLTGAARLAAVVDLAALYSTAVAEGEPGADANAARRFHELFGLPAERFVAVAELADKAMRDQAPLLGLAPLPPHAAPARKQPVPAGDSATRAPSLPPSSNGPAMTSLPSPPSRESPLVLEMVGEITQAILAGHDITDILSVVLEGIARSGPFDVVLLALLNPSKDQVVARLGYGEGVKEALGALSAPMRAGAGLLAECILQRSPKLVANGSIQLLLPAGSPAPSLRVQGLLLCPLLIKDKPVGAVVAARSPGSAVCDADLRLMQLFCSQACLALQQASSSPGPRAAA